MGGTRRTGAPASGSWTRPGARTEVLSPNDGQIQARNRSGGGRPRSTWTALCGRLQRGPDRDDLVGIDRHVGSLPPVSRRTSYCTAGIRVDPPTKMTSSMSFALTFRRRVDWRSTNRLGMWGFAAVAGGVG